MKLKIEAVKLQNTTHLLIFVHFYTKRSKNCSYRMMTYLQIDKRWTGVLRPPKHKLVSLTMTKCCSALTTTQTFTVTIDRSRRVAGRTPRPPLGSARGGTLRSQTSSKTRTLLKVCSQGDISLGAMTSESREGARRIVITTSQ